MEHIQGSGAELVFHDHIILQEMKGTSLTLADTIVPS